ncbi:MAG: hypoxanthine phosphoribosyltransferase [Spirochaetota bacterium]
MQTKKIPVLISASEIQQRVRELAEEINQRHNDSLLVVGVLKGSFLFMADLVRLLSCPITVDFVQASSYGNSTESSGEVTMVKDLTVAARDKHILLVEDIVDTGNTLQALYWHLESYQPKSLQICTLLFKKHKYRLSIPIDYYGFTIEDQFVIGYGMDYAEQFRHLDYIGIYET